MRPSPQEWHHCLAVIRLMTFCVTQKESSAIISFCLSNKRGTFVLREPKTAHDWRRVKKITPHEWLYALSRQDFNRLALYAGAVRHAPLVKRRITKKDIHELNDEWGDELRLFVLKTASLLGARSTQKEMPLKRQEMIRQGSAFIRNENNEPFLHRLLKLMPHPPQQFS